MGRRFLIFSFYFLTILLGFYFIHISKIRAAYSGVCDLIENNFYDNREDFQNWIEQCRQFAVGIDPFADRLEVLGQFQQLMNRMGTSHFHIYDQEQDQRLWQGVATDSGLTVANALEGVRVVRVATGSSAQLSGFKVGDLILSVNDNDEFLVKEVTHTSGHYKVKRGEQILRIHMKIKRYQADGPPRILKGQGASSILEISSFRPEYFEWGAWQKLMDELKNQTQVTVDLRENAGGNFVAMLRALSLFVCTPRVAGELHSPRFVGKDQGLENVFQDDPSDEAQMEGLTKSASLILKTFEGHEPCFRGSVKILTSQETSSVAEIFTSAMRNLRGAKIYGQTTAGEVVLAVWYSIPQLGTNYTISIPKSIFLDDKGQVLEGAGVRPDHLVDSERIWLPASEILRGN